MGLISTIGNLGSTVTNLDQGVEDLVNAFTNSIFGNDNVNKKIINNGDKEKSANPFFDLRGREAVFRGKSNTYNSKNFKYHFDMDKDFYWYDTAYDGLLWNLIKPQIPKMYIHEFQPYLQSFLGQLVSFGKYIEKKVIEYEKKKEKGKNFRLGEELDTTPTTMDSFNSVMTLGSQLFKNTPYLNQAAILIGNKAISDISKKPSLLYDKDVDVALVNPIAAVNKMFIDGVWLHTYTIPLLNKEQFNLISSIDMFAGLDGGGSFKQAVSNLTANENKENIDKTSNMFSTIPSTPKFNPKLHARNKISTEFYLINKNSVYLVRNYRFLMAFAAGTMPVQLEYGKMHSPNVYYVEIPGKRLLVWAQISLNITLVGKYRKDEYATMNIKKMAAGNSPIYNENMLWPEAWKLSITIHDFTPNTFNTFEHYLTKGSIFKSLAKDGIGTNYDDDTRKENLSFKGNHLSDIKNK